MKKTLLFSLMILVLAGCRPVEKVKIVRIDTAYGSIRIFLHPETPIHRENFLKLTADGLLDSLLFHRTIGGFMIQGGDPDSKHAKAGQALGDGDVGYTLPAEFDSTLYHRRGAVGAARDDNPGKRSSGIQFYLVQGRKLTKEELHTDMRRMRTLIAEVNQKPGYDTLVESITSYRKSHSYSEYRNHLMMLKPALEKVTGESLYQPVSTEKLSVYLRDGGTPHLDGDYTVFGQVIEGMEVVDAIAAVPTDSLDRPLVDIRFHSFVEELTKEKIDRLLRKQKTHE